MQMEQDNSYGCSKAEKLNFGIPSSFSGVCVPTRKCDILEISHVINVCEQPAAYVSAARRVYHANENKSSSKRTTTNRGLGEQ